MPKLTAARLRELLECDPESGTFTRRLASGRWKAGTPAGGVRPDGYTHIYIDGRFYMRHRLVWFFVHGKWPSGQLDHKNGAEKGDGITNLRPATPRQNSRNRGPQTNNKSGLKGVNWHQGKWRATILRQGKHAHLGYFNTPTLAHAAYKQAAQTLHGEFARFA